MYINNATFLINKNILNADKCNKYCFRNSTQDTQKIDYLFVLGFYFFALFYLLLHQRFRPKYEEGLEASWELRR